MSDIYVQSSSARKFSKQALPKKGATLNARVSSSVLDAKEAMT
jgi:hypothetical protein